MLLFKKFDVLNLDNIVKDKMSVWECWYLFNMEDDILFKFNVYNSLVKKKLVGFIVDFVLEEEEVIWFFIVEVFE